LYVIKKIISIKGLFQLQEKTHTFRQIFISHYRNTIYLFGSNLRALIEIYAVLKESLGNFCVLLNVLLKISNGKMVETRRDKLSVDNFPSLPPFNLTCVEKEQWSCRLTPRIKTNAGKFLKC